MAHRYVVSATIGNEHGHYEDRDFVLLQERAVKRACGSRSHGWIVDRPVSLHFDPLHRDRARQLVRIRQRHYHLWGWKDPRTVLFLDQWDELVDDLRVVAVWRHKEAVVDSLLRRAATRNADPAVRLSRDQAEHLWDSYNTALCDWLECNEDRTVLLPLHGLIASPERAHAVIRDIVPNLAHERLGTVYDSRSLGRVRSEGSDTLTRRLVQLSCI